MQPATYDFNIQQGRILEKTFEISDNETFVFTDYDPKMQIRLVHDSTVIWDSSVSGTGLLSVSGDTTLVLQIPSSITHGFTFEKASYDIRLTHKTELDVIGLPKQVNILKGTITLIKEITE